MRLTVCILAIGAILSCRVAVAAPLHRSRAAVDAFKREHPCPITGSPRGRCPGYVVDHVRPLCASGADAPSNMQWQTVADGKAKDRVERQLCAKENRR